MVHHRFEPSRDEPGVRACWQCGARMLEEEYRRQVEMGGPDADCRPLVAAQPSFFDDQETSPR